MNVATPEDGRIVFKKKRPFKFIAICLAVLLVAGGTFVFLRTRAISSAETAVQRSSFVVRGQLLDSIAGSAPIVSSNRSELSPKVTATLQQINCKEGDQIKAGDVLFILDNTDAMLEIENTKNNMAQMQLNLDSTLKSISGLAIEAPYSGQVTNFSVKLGDSVNKGGALMTLTDVSKLSVTLPFSSSIVKNVQLGQKADVYIPDLMISMEGSVTYKSSKPYSTLSGGELYNIEITLDNPGSLAEGMIATGEIVVNGILLDSVKSGQLAYVNKKVLKSDAGGTIVGLSVRENEYVNAGDILVKLENDDLLLTSSTNDIKMKNLISQLEIQQKQLDYYTIVAPFNGTITSMGTSNEGDTVKQGTMLAVVSDMTHLEFSISIDELDISQIAVGQEVKITAEALEDTQITPYTGKVSKVAMEGSSSNGVTTYPVTVSVEESAAGKLKTGMNIDAEIYISNKVNVLMVPLEAVIKMGNRSFAYVKGKEATGQGETTVEGTTTEGANSSNAVNANRRRRGGSANTNDSQAGNSASGSLQAQSERVSQKNVKNSYYDGATLVPVETGISNDTYIEIISGLSEGQEVVLPKTSSASAASATSGFQRNRDNGFISGSTPAGGMTGGRMPGGF